MIISTKILVILNHLILLGLIIVSVNADDEEVKPSTEASEESTNSPGSGEIGETTKKSKNPPSDESCDPKECRMRGYCEDYKVCNNNTMKFNTLKCWSGLYWNPKWLEHEIGGACDKWEHLGKQLQKQYEDDPDCVSPSEKGCEFKKKEDCSNIFNYRTNRDPKGKWQELHCPEGLFWEDQMKTCNFCDKVLNAKTKELCKCK